MHIEAVRWEHKVFPAHAGFQAQISPAAECDLVIAIFWTRLGTPLPEDFARMESGERYPSGTAYEVLTALEARKKGDRPDVYVFRKAEATPGATDHGRAQRKDLNAFFNRWFQTPDGQFLRAYYQFDSTDAFERLVDKLLRDWIAERVPHDHSVIWPIETMGSPFRALLPFDAKHAAIYFGRDRKVTRAVEQLQSVGRARRIARAGPRNVPFLLIVGESGAGKSSLMRAGLAPRLTAAGVVPGVDSWRTAIARIGDDPNPFFTLAKALLVVNDEERGFGAALPELADRGFHSAESLADRLAMGGEIREKRRRAPAAGAIIRALAQIQADERRRGGFQRRLHANLLILVDQLENLFAADVSDDQRSAFARLIFALCATRRVWVVATLRSDIYPRVITPGDFLALKDAGAVYDLAAPGESELTEIVQKSAAAAGLVYEQNLQSGERLDERILQDAQGRNTLPLLQFALDRLFKEKESVGRQEIIDGHALIREELRLTFAAYEAMHGLDGAINQAAEAALGKLGRAEIEALPRLLRSLAVPVHETTSPTGVSSDLTVRTVARAEAVPDLTTARLVDELIAARIIVTHAADDAKSGADGGLLGISHQRVFESWERARAIVLEHKEFFRIRDEVEGQRQRWQERGRPKALLLAKGVPLAEAQKIVKNYAEELPKDLRTYVMMSNRRAQRFNILMAATAAVFACLFVAATVLWFEAGRAEATAKTSYQAAKGAVIDLVGAAIESLQDVQGIRVATVQKVLAIVDKTIRMVQDVSIGDAELARARAKMQFQAGKAFQKKEEHAKAVTAANESYAIRASLTNFGNPKSSPSFQSTPGEWRWELSQSLEFIGDLYREEQDYQDARDWFEKTLAVRRDLMAQAPDMDDWAQGVSQTYTRLGDLDFASNLAAALQNYDNSLAIAAKYFLRNPEADRWQRELSWAFNKIGDVQVRTGDVKVKAGELANSDYVAALEAFTDSLCLRFRNSGRDPSRTELTRDLPYSLERIAGAKAKLDDADGAQEAYFEALAIRRRLAASVPDNALYRGNVAASLQLIGDYYTRSDLKLALAFYDAAADSRLEITKSNPDDKRARINLEEAQRKAADIRQSVIKKYKQEDFSGKWWQKPVHETEKAFAKCRTDLDPAVCMETVTRSIDQLIGPKTTANIR